MKNKLTTETFIERAKEIHGDRFDYSESEYINAKVKIKIICKKHGVFEQNTSIHLRGHGCKKCNDERNSIINRKTFENFLEKSEEIHGDKYVYFKENYSTRNKKMIIFCKKHGNFTQTPNSHLLGHGCPKCANENHGINATREFDEFCKKAISIHGMAWTYYREDYERFDKKIKINCSIHGDFYQTRNNHLNGQICPKCNNLIKSIDYRNRNPFSWNKESWLKRLASKECIFYILKCFNETEVFFKIGITSKTIKGRYYGKSIMPYDFLIIKEIRDTPEIIWKIENDIKTKNNDFIYQPKIKFGGSKTECFSKLIS